MSKYKELIAQARIAYQEKRLDEAIRLYEDAFREMVVVEDLIDLALAYLDNKMPVKALKAFQSLIEVFPDSAQGYYGLGLVYEQLGKADLAEESYLKAVKIHPAFAQAYFNIALLADERNDERKAYDYYKKTLLYDPGHFWANLNVGSIYEKNNYLELALNHTLRAYEANPEEKMVAFNLGVIYARLGDHEQAVKYYREEIGKKECYQAAYLNIALIYKDVYKDRKTSRQYLLEGISRFKDNTSLWYNLGCLYALDGDYPNAHNCFLYALVKQPELRETLEADEELMDFRSSPFYEDLLKSIKGGQ